MKVARSVRTRCDRRRNEQGERKRAIAVRRFSTHRGERGIRMKACQVGDPDEKAPRQVGGEGLQPAPAHYVTLRAVTRRASASQFHLRSS